tara:strand:+ start:6553 stop:7299 length:747 start_codon:yes stop_codon:yes gene_type:complete
LKFTPAAIVTWALDVAGNAVATAIFREASDTLVIDSTAELTLDTHQWPVFDIAASAANYPFLLTQDDMDDLGALRLQSYLDSTGQLRKWAEDFVVANPTDTLTLLKDICAGVAALVTYEVREEDDAQSPVQTLTRKCGSCRDYAVLFVDAVRSLGFGARIVSGYLYDPNQDLLGNTSSGSTHAWAEVFVPGAGWISFDPTNRSVGDYNLIPVAVARHIHQTMPVIGSFIGDQSSFEKMDVQVCISHES